MVGRAGPSAALDGVDGPPYSVIVANRPTFVTLPNLLILNQIVFPFREPAGCSSLLLRWGTDTVMSLVPRVRTPRADRAPIPRSVRLSACAAALSLRRVAKSRLAVGVFVVCFANPAVGGEPAVDFLKRLRAAGYFDTAITYLERLDRYPGVDPQLLRAVELEKAQTYIDAAVASRNKQQRDGYFEQAESSLQSFLSGGSHPRAPEARLRLGTIQMARAERLMAGQPDAAERAQARGSYLAAAETFDTIVDNLRDRLQSMRGQRVDAAKDPEKAALRDRYRNDFLQAKINAGNARRLAAATFEQPAEDGKKLLEEALTRFDDLTDKYGDYLPGAMAMMYRGKAQQMLGRDGEAIDSYLRTLEQPDADLLREAKFEAASGVVELWLDDSPPKYDAAIERGQPLLDDVRPDEKRSQAAQKLKLSLAKAYLARAADEANNKPAVVKRARASGRRLLNEANRIPGDHQAETKRLLAELGIEAEAPQLEIIEDPQNLDEALTAARELVRSVETLTQSLEVLEQQGEVGDVAQQRSDIEAEIRQAREKASMILRRGLATVHSGSDRELLTQARQLLAYVLYRQQRYREAAVAGGFLARTAPGTDPGLQGGLLALNSLQLLISQSGDGVGRDLASHLERLGRFLSDSWPDNPKVAAAQGAMIRLALGNDRWKKAAEMITEMPDSPEKASFQRLMGQLTWNRSVQARGEGEDAKADRLLDEAIADLQAGLEGVPGKLVAAETMQAALILAKAHLRENNSEPALRALDHPVYGPTELVSKLDAPSPSFESDLYSTELRAVVAQMTDPENDGSELLGRADRAMQKLRESVSGEDAESKLLGILVRLASDIRKQIDSAPPARKDKLLDAFRVFVDRIAESTDDPTTLRWVASTLLKMGESSMASGERKASGRAARLIESAVKSFEELIAHSSDPSLAVRYQLGRAHRLLGSYKSAIDELETILVDKPMMLDAQVEAATAYERWAAELPPRYKDKAYEAALVGARPNDQGKNTVWGWGKISQLTSRNPKYREMFFEARYHLAVCRFLMGKALDNEEVMEKAITDITKVHALYPDLGGGKQKAKFDALLKQVQRTLGKPAAGLP